MGHHSKQVPEQNINCGRFCRVPLTLDIIKTLSGDNNALTKAKLELRLNINHYSLQNLGRLLPFLVELDISNSNIDTLRDLGSTMQHLRVLRVSNCKLTDLDGVSSCANLTQLDAPNNYITDVFPCALLQALEILDLEKNCVQQYHTLAYLSVCSNLRFLILRNNPISGSNYRNKVWTLIPQITFLDDIELTAENDGKNSQQLCSSNNTDLAVNCGLLEPPVRRRSNLTDLMNACKKFSYFHFPKTDTNQTRRNSDVVEPSEHLDEDSNATKNPPNNRKTLKASTIGNKTVKEPPSKCKAKTYSTINNSKTNNGSTINSKTNNGSTINSTTMKDSTTYDKTEMVDKRLMPAMRQSTKTFPNNASTSRPTTSIPEAFAFSSSGCIVVDLSENEKSDPE